MALGMLVGALAQDTTTTTGTGAITLGNAVPAGAPPGSTTFATAFTYAGTISYPISNIFYAIIDGSSNIEVSIGTLTSATNLTRDFCLFTGTANLVAPYVPAFVEGGNGTPLNFAAGTKNVYSNATLAANTNPYWQRLPNLTGGSDGGITQDIMSGTFTGVLTQSGGTTNVPCRYKVANDGLCTLTFPAQVTQNTTGTAITVTGIPASISNLTTTTVIGLVVSNGNVVLGTYAIAGGATPTSTGTITLAQSTGVSPIAFTGTFSASVVNGVPATSISYQLF